MLCQSKIRYFKTEFAIFRVMYGYPYDRKEWTMAYIMCNVLWADLYRAGMSFKQHVSLILNNSETFFSKQMPGAAIRGETPTYSRL